MQCTEYKDNTLMKHNAEKAEENGYDSDKSVEVTKNKSKVEGSVGKVE